MKQRLHTLVQGQAWGDDKQRNNRIHCTEKHTDTLHIYTQAFSDINEDSVLGAKTGIQISTHKVKDKTKNCQNSVLNDMQGWRIIDVHEAVQILTTSGNGSDNEMKLECTFCYAKKLYICVAHGLLMAQC